MISYIKKIGVTIALFLSGVGLYFLTRKFNKKDSQLTKTIEKEKGMGEKVAKLNSEVTELEYKREALKKKRKELKVPPNWYEKFKEDNK